MIQISENIKRTRIKEELARRIVNGEFSFGERFPGLHDLSREYSVSYVTVSKAVKLLESEGYLRCQKGIGHFVCYVKPDQVTTKKSCQSHCRFRPLSLLQNSFSGRRAPVS